jgi:hypothetical protein
VARTPGAGVGAGVAAAAAAAAALEHADHANTALHANVRIDKVRVRNVASKRLLKEI